MTLQQIHYIIEISEQGSMNKAAESLYVSQPSLTSAVRELEKELGITIFLRSGRGVTLTNDGSEFLVYARQVYHQYEILLEKSLPHHDRNKVLSNLGLDYSNISCIHVSYYSQLPHQIINGFFWYN